MSDLRWYRSIYWRVALGLIAFLALMLVAEAALFLWTTDRIAGSMPARSPRRLAVLVASDVSGALTADPSLNLQQYVRDQFGRVLQTFLVIMSDGRVVANHDDVPAELIDAVETEVAMRQFGLGPLADEEEATLTLLRRGEFAQIIVDGVPVGRVAVLPGGPPFTRIVRELGPTLGAVASIVLGVGALMIALLVFGPVRRRLKQVQEATERLGAGDLTARAPERGGDEVAEVAHSFNRMADELTRRTGALEEADKMRRQLLADVSHELMTPLTAMRGYIETLSMSEVTLDPETRERYLGIVTEETHRLERIIGDLLDLARLEGGGTTMRRERVRIAMLFERVAARHERELSARGITLERQVDAGAEEVTGDFGRLEQALQNLAANALRHTPEHGRIVLLAQRSGERVRIVVRDTGPGIAPEHLPMIFDRFYKVDASRKASGGSGLGLSIVKAIVERHGGTISAHNDNGAVFEIMMPA